VLRPVLLGQAVKKQTCVYIIRWYFSGASRGWGISFGCKGRGHAPRFPDFTQWTL